MALTSMSNRVASGPAVVVGATEIVTVTEVVTVTATGSPRAKGLTVKRLNQSKSLMVR